MFKRMMVLITLGAALAAFAIWQWDISIAVPFIGVFAASQLIGAAMMFIIMTLVVTLAAGLISCG
jgi:hypothetical protein